MNSNSKVLSSLIWKLLERGGTQGVQFIIQIVLARILSPNDYGIIALIMVFIALANVFVQSGFNTALIQKKEADEEDFSSVFYVSLLIAGILYIILFISAPIISKFYRLPQLINIIRVLSITLFFGAFNSIQNAIVARNMIFKKLFFSSLGAIIISGIIGIVIAYKGFGVWALVYQQLINQLCICLILWFTIKWRPKLLFSLEKIKILFSFGSKLLLSALLDTGYREGTNLIIGKVYTPTMLGYYSRGDQFPKLIIGNVNGSIQSVIFPVLSSFQDDKEKIREIVRKGITMSSYIIFPMMIGLCAVAEPLVKLLLTDKWLPCVPFLRIFCLTYALWPIHTTNLQAINALGRSDIFLKLEIIKKIIGIIIIIITVRYSPLIMAIGIFLTSIISAFINSFPNKKFLNYSYFEQLKDILPSLILSVIMGVIIYSIVYLRFSNIIIIILQIFLGILIYIGLSYFLKIKSFKYILEIIKNKRS